MQKADRFGRAKTFILCIFEAGT